MNPFANYFDLEWQTESHNMEQDFAYRFQYTQESTLHLLIFFFFTPPTGQN